MVAKHSPRFGAGWLANLALITMKVHVAWDHSIFKNVDLVAVKSSDP